MNKEEEDQYDGAVLNPELASMLQHEANQAMGNYSMAQGMMMGHHHQQTGHHMHGGPHHHMAQQGQQHAAAAAMMHNQFYRMPQMSGIASAAVDMGLEEEPLYVNAKQYHRILKRRQARANREAQLKIQREKVCTACDGRIAQRACC